MQKTFIGLVIFLLLLIFFFQNQTSIRKVDADSSSSSEQRLFQSLKDRIEKVKSKCGQICVTEQSKTEIIGKGWYDIVRKPFTCENMFKYDFFDSSSIFKKSPETIPSVLYDDFTYQGRVHTFHRYANDKPMSSRTIVWTKTAVAELQEKIRNGTSVTQYGEQAFSSLKLGMTKTDDIKGAHVLVIGSRGPWVEAMLLEQGAAHVSTLEYSSIKCDHPRITTYTPVKLTEAFLDGTLPVFDGVVSYSSLEHSGLGRYGDGLNPFGDLIAMARSWCLIKDLGFAIVGVPTGPDHITFNLHRVYGPLMYSHLFANWQQIWTDTDINLYTSEDHRTLTYRGRSFQTVHVLRKNIAMFNLLVAK